MKNKEIEVDHPSHYNKGKIEVIEVIKNWKLDFCLGNSVKYIYRSNWKGTPTEDLRKAIWYLTYFKNNYIHIFNNALDPMFISTEYWIQSVLDDWKMSDLLEAAIINIYFYKLGGRDMKTIEEAISHLEEYLKSKEEVN